MDKQLYHIALFAGIHGFSYAAEQCGIETVAYSEVDPFCNAVARKHYPNAKPLGDIRNVNRETAPYADIISCGFPCQPWSVAGKQLGKSDTRWLGEEMLRVFRELRTPFLILENVTGFIRMALDEMLIALEAIGYTCETFVVPAAGVNAPHRRDRLIILAYTNSLGRFQSEREESRERIYCRPKAVLQGTIERLSSQRTTSHTNGISGKEKFKKGSKGPQTRLSLATASAIFTSHADSEGQPNGSLDACKEQWLFTNSEYHGCQRRQSVGRSKQKRKQTPDPTLSPCQTWAFTYAYSQGLSQRLQSGFRSLTEKKGTHQGSESARNDSTPGWSEFPTQSPLCDGNDGLPAGLVRPSDRRVRQLISRQRTEAIKAGGNAVVPAVFVPFFQAIKQHCQLTAFTS